MKYFERNPTLFSKNRSRFMQAMKKNSIAIFCSNQEVLANGDRTYPFSQNSDLFWLTGIEQEETIIILYPDNLQKKYTQILAIIRPNKEKEKWDGHRLTKEDAQKISSVETVVFIDELAGLLQLCIHYADTIYLDSNENDRKGNFIPTAEYLFIEKIQQQYPLHQYERAAKIMRSLRSVKTKEEVALIQKAIDITKNTFIDLLQFIKPDVFEYEIEAEIYRSFLRQKSSRPAYDSIIASGESACILHYIDNNKSCKSGQLILMDFGAQYSYYCADLTRTVPINGKFTKRQKEVYDACLWIHNFCKTCLKPGI
ncbi:MAG: aminopeptidase P N-terminal domain-containing protein, partial [Chitinophagaceae bacterium]